MKRRRVDPGKAAQAAMGGFYDRIEVTRANWPTCSRCGEPSTMIGQDGECLRCLLDRKRQAREATGQGPF